MRLNPPFQPIDKFLHTGEPQCRTEVAGKNPPSGDQVLQGLLRQAAVRQIFLHGRLVGEGGCLVEGIVHVVKGKAALAQPAAQFLQACTGIGAGQVHLIDKEEHRHLVALQQPPQGQGMGLDPIGAADHQNGIVQHLQGALHLGRKVHMAGGVQQGHFQIAKGNGRPVLKIS